MTKHCKKCAQHPELYHTGKSPGQAQWCCIVCNQEYYVDKDGHLIKERPFSWPVGKKANPESWVIDENGYWVKA